MKSVANKKHFEHSGIDMLLALSPKCFIFFTISTTFGILGTLTHRNGQQSGHGGSSFLLAKHEPWRDTNSEPTSGERTNATTAQNAFPNDILITNFPRFFAKIFI